MKPPGDQDRRIRRRSENSRLPHDHQSRPRRRRRALSNAMADKRFSKGKSVHNGHSLGPVRADQVPQARRQGRRRNHRRDLHRQLGQELHLFARSASPADRDRPAGRHGDSERQALPAGLQAERLAAIGETTAALSHSIKNILQALRGGADVVEMGLRGNNLPRPAKAGGSSIAISKKFTT